MVWKVVEERTVAEFKTEAEANAYLDHLPMEDEDYHKQVIEFAEPCDNNDCESGDNVKEITLKEEFDGECYSWCESCRKRDWEMIEDEE
jgi:hypothetical protein